jgi:hypothetical protein
MKYSMKHIDVKWYKYLFPYYVKLQREGDFYINRPAQENVNVIYGTEYLQSLLKSTMI